MVSKLNTEKCRISISLKLKEHKDVLSFKESILMKVLSPYLESVLISINERLKYRLRIEN